MSAAVTDHERRGRREVVAIGVDTHKASLAACAIDELGRAISERTFSNNPKGHEEFVRWAAACLARGASVLRARPVSEPGWRGC